MRDGADNAGQKVKDEGLLVIAKGHIFCSVNPHAESVGGLAITGLFRKHFPHSTGIPYLGVVAEGFELFSEVRHRRRDDGEATSGPGRSGRPPSFEPGVAI